jgi:hypothetical protein
MATTGGDGKDTAGFAGRSDEGHVCVPNLGEFLSQALTAGPGNMLVNKREFQGSGGWYDYPWG